MANKPNITRKEFKEHAKPVLVKLNDIPILAEAREFSTLSLGWGATGKTVMEVNGKIVQVQIGINLTIVGSKELEREG